MIAMKEGGRDKVVKSEVPRRVRNRREGRKGRGGWKVSASFIGPWVASRRPIDYLLRICAAVRCSGLTVLILSFKFSTRFCSFARSVLYRRWLKERAKQDR